MLKKLIIFLCVLFGFSINLYAKGFVLRGGYNYTYYFLDVYDATLFMDKKCLYPSCDFILELRYKTGFTKQDITKQSIKEMKQQEDFDLKTEKKYMDTLIKIFPNVKENDVIKGKMVSGYAEFYFNNQFIGKINDKKLSRRFFDIWLSPKTSEPQMQEALLGKSIPQK